MSSENAKGFFLIRTLRLERIQKKKCRPVNNFIGMLHTVMQVIYVIAVTIKRK